MDSKKEFLKKVKWDSIIIALLTVITGIICVAMPDSAGDALCLVFGIYLIAASVALFVRFFWIDRFLGAHLLILSAVMLLVGVFCLVYPKILQNFLTVLLGLLIVIDALSTLADSIYCAKAKVSGWFVMFILSLVTAILGVVVIFSSFDTVVIFAGCSLIIEGVERFVLTLVYSRKIKQAKEKIEGHYKAINNMDLSQSDVIIQDADDDQNAR